MSDYTQVTDYSTKDSLASGDPLKIIKGSDIDAELAAISTAIVSKADDSAVVHDTGDETIAGNKTFSGTVKMSGKSVIEAEGAAVASSATPNIWAGDGNTIHITGNTTITGFAAAPQAGARQRLIFDDVLILTQGANLNLNGGGANITTAVDDWAEVYADTTTQFDLVLHRKSGAPVVAVTGNSMVLLDTKVASASATIDFTSFIDSTYDEYQIHFDQVVPADNAVYLNCRISQAASFKTDAAGYSTAFHSFNTAGVTQNVTGSNSFITITDTANGISNGATHSGVDGIVYLKKPSGTSRFKNIFWEVAYHPNIGAPDITIGHGAGFYNVNQAAIDGLRFLFATGNIASGNFYLYGIKKA